MKSVALKATPRTLGRHAGAKKLRESGRIPAIIYGRQAPPQNLELNAKEMEDLIHHSASENLLGDLAVKDDARPTRLALVQEIQHHPLSGKVLHVDFHEIAENEKVTVSIPVETVGEPDGVKNEGGVLEHVLFKIRARGLAKDLPEAVVVDVAHLKIGDAIHLGEIKVPAGVTLVGDKHMAVISVAAPRAEEEVAAETAAEPLAADAVEMIKEKKEEGEEGAAPTVDKKGAGTAGAKGTPAAGAKGAAAPGAKGAAAAAPAKGAAPGAPAAADKKAASGEKKK